MIDRRLADLQRHARSINPDFEICANTYRQRPGCRYYLVEGQALDFEASRLDTGAAPGLYQAATPSEPVRHLRKRDVVDDVVCTNVFDYKWANARRLPAPVACHLQTHVAVDDYYLHNADSALLCHAEATAFGAAAGVNLNLAQGHYTPDERHALRSQAATFFRFVDKHPDLFTGLTSHADVGLAYHDLRHDAGPAADHQCFELARTFGERGVLWDLVTAERATAQEIGRFRAVVYHDVERISEREAAALVTFLHGGGVVLVSATTTGQLYPDGRFSPFWIGIRDDHHRLRAANATSVWPPRPLDAAPTTIEHHEIGLGRLVVCPPDSNDPDTILEHLDIALDKTTRRPRRHPPRTRSRTPTAHPRRRLAQQRENRPPFPQLQRPPRTQRSRRRAHPPQCRRQPHPPDNRTGTDRDHPPHTRARRQHRRLNPIPTRRTHTQVPAPHLEHPPDRRHPVAVTKLKT